MFTVTFNSLHFRLFLLLLKKVFGMIIDTDLLVSINIGTVKFAIVKLIIGILGYKKKPFTLAINSWDCLGRESFGVWIVKVAGWVIGGHLNFNA